METDGVYSAHMKTYFFKRVLVLIPTLFGVSVICFGLTQLLPGGPADYWFSLGTEGSLSSPSTPNQITHSDREALSRYYGYGAPLYRRYFNWMGQVGQGDWGTSFQYETAVASLLSPALKTTLSLGALSLLGAIFVFLPLGIFHGFRPHSLWARASGMGLLFTHALPPFLLALGLLTLFSPESIALPLLCYALSFGSFLWLLTQQSVAHTRHQEFYYFAQSQGLGTFQIALRLIRNAAAPLCSQWGTWTTHFFAGSVVIETLFNLNGIGRLGYHALLSRDYPVMLALILVLCVMYLLANLLSELVLALLDPRVRYAA